MGFVKLGSGGCLVEPIFLAEILKPDLWMALVGVPVNRYLTPFLEVEIE